MSKNTDYCNAIAALLAEQHKIPRLTVGMTDRERGRINILRKALHRQMEGLQQQAAKEFATLNGWRHDRTVVFNQNSYSWRHPCSTGRNSMGTVSAPAARLSRLFSRNTTAIPSGGSRWATLRHECG